MMNYKNDVPEGFVLLQRENGQEKYAACITGRFAGWLMWKHPDGQWVSQRKLEQWELMQVEDQRDGDIVFEGATPAAPAPSASVQAIDTSAQRVENVEGNEHIAPAHRTAWRDAITECINREVAGSDRAAYWEHELAAYDRAFARLLDKPEAIRAEPVPQGVPRNARRCAETLSVMLWLYRRLPRVYERPQFIEQTIHALAKGTGIDVATCMAERGATAPTATSGGEAVLMGNEVEVVVDRHGDARVTSHDLAQGTHTLYLAPPSLPAASDAASVPSDEQIEKYRLIAKTALAARNAALKDAATLAEGMNSHGEFIADAIRALISKGA